MLKMLRNRKGFTLVEVMIVVAIIALLAAIAIPNLIKVREGSDVTACLANRRTVKNAISLWAIKEEKNIAALQAKFGVSPATVNISGVSGDNVEHYFNPAEAVCPSDGTTYTSTVDSNGLITVSCDTTGH